MTSRLGWACSRAPGVVARRGFFAAPRVSPGVTGVLRGAWDDQLPALSPAGKRAKPRDVRGSFRMEAAGKAALSSRWLLTSSCGGCTRSTCVTLTVSRHHPAHTSGALAVCAAGASGRRLLTRTRGAASSRRCDEPDPFAKVRRCGDVREPMVIVDFNQLRGASFDERPRVFDRHRLILPAVHHHDA